MIPLRAVAIPLDCRNLAVNVAEDESEYVGSGQWCEGGPTC